MRLLIHSTEFPPGPGGIGIQAHQLAVELVNLGWEIEVVTVQSYKDQKEIEAFNSNQPFNITPVPEVEFSLREGYDRLVAVRRSIERIRPDVVMASGQRALWVAAWAGPKHRVPWVAITHGTELDAKRRWIRGLTHWALDRADAIVVVSRYTGGHLRRLGVKRVPAFVIGNGADSSRFEVQENAVVEDFMKRFDLTGARIVLTVGNLTARKGQEVVIRALPRVLERVPDLRYAMVGLPSEGARLQELAESLGVAHAVRVLGPLDEKDLVAAYSSCEVFAMTSQHTSTGDFEGYGIAVVEAAMCGKPAVVSSGSGLEEAVSDGETGVVVPQSDPVGTGDALISLLEDTPLRTKLGDAAAARAKAEQNWGDRAGDYDRVLRWVTGDMRAVDDLRLDHEVLA